MFDEIKVAFGWPWKECEKTEGFLKLYPTKDSIGRYPETDRERGELNVWKSIGAEHDGKD